MELKGVPVFYVYVHKKVDGTVFYVGKGSGKRAWESTKRNKHWKHIVAKYKTYQVEIVLKDIQEWFAFEYEQDLIAKYGLIKDGGSLCNLTLGGEGISGWRASKEQKAKLSTIATGILNNNADLTVYTFKNINTNESFTGTRVAFYNTYAIKLDDLFKRSDVYFIKGWYIDDGSARKSKIDYKLYCFKNTVTQEEVVDTRKAFKARFCIDTKFLFTKNPIKTYKNWSIHYCLI